MLKPLRLKYKIEYDLDDPRRTIVHSDIIRKKPFLNKIYLDWYQIFKKEMTDIPTGDIIEIGSGGGFIKEIIPSVITSDILKSVGCDMTFSAEEIPFPENSLSAILMLNTFHHIPNPEKFLSEAERCLKINGKVIMIETAKTIWSSFIYKNFHHEAFNPNGSWKLDGNGPLSVSNQALPWIIFERDQQIFNKKFPCLKIAKIDYHTPLRYLLSGGVSRKAFVPIYCYNFIMALEKILKPFSRFSGMFVTITLTKNC
jgi:SAM-dependent methyltransferase